MMDERSYREHVISSTGSMPPLSLFGLVLLSLCLTWSASTEAARIKPSRMRRQAGNFYPGNVPGRIFCPQPNGQFADLTNCSRYLQCDQGRASVTDCFPPGLVFNRRTGLCDFPANVPYCRPPQGQITSSPSQSINYDICSSAPNGGDPVNGYQVPHPQICNAFYTCSANYLYAPCMFCPENTYFSMPERRCRENGTGTFNIQCAGRQYVPHDQKVFRQLDGTCRSNGYFPQRPLPGDRNFVRGRFRPGGNTYYPNLGLGNRYNPLGIYYPPTYGGPIYQDYNGRFFPGK